MELEKKGIWKKINEIPEEQLENQLEELAVDHKKSQLNVDRIVEVFDVDHRVVQSERNPEFLRSRENILKKKQKKDS